MYSNLSADGSFSVSNTNQSARGSQRRFGVSGDGSCPDASGECYVAFFGADYPDSPNYNVVSTDYDTYSIVYDCS